MEVCEIACAGEGLTAGAIAPVVEQIASPVTGICPRSENLKLYVNYVPSNLLV